MSKKIILVRHAESVWNLENKFTGWADVPLTKYGEFEAKKTGQYLFKNNFIPTLTFSSIQQRSIITSQIILNEINRPNKIIKDWRLNERHYGKLTGYNRSDVKWKGGYFDVPPNIIGKSNINLVKVNGYNPIFGESYYMTYLRIIPFWNTVKNNIFNNDTVMICAHKNSLKVLIKEIEDIDEKNINKIEVLNAIPLIYTFDNSMNLTNKLSLDKI